MNWSIERKLPLLVSSLLLVVGVALLLVGYGGVRMAARRVADERLTRADSAIANLLQAGQQRARLVVLGKDSLVAAYVTSRSSRVRDSVLAAMRRLVSDTASNASLQVWDSAGRLLLRTGAFPRADSLLATATGDSLVVGPLVWRDTILYYGSVAPIRRDGRLLGTIQQVARVNLSERTRRGLTGLAGGDVAYLLGNTAGDPWTDFETIVPAPPTAVRLGPKPVRYERGAMKRAVGRAVPGTPWSVVAELPKDRILAPARAFVVTMAPIAGFIVLIGALGAWWGSRRMTRPLREITTTAEAIAAGELDRRVPVRNDDELGRLGRSFNTMAERVVRSLQTSETRLRSVTETAHDAIIAADGEGLIRFWNPGATRVFGYSAEEVLGKPLTTLMPQRYHDLHRSGIRRYVETLEARVVGKTVELEGRRKDGTEFPIELSLGAAPVQGGMSFTGIIRDITERKRTAEALQATNAELESFSYSVSHDLRAPLRAIHGFARILLEDHKAQLDPEAQRLLGVIDQNTRRMGHLIDDLLAFSRLGRQEVTGGRVDMSEIARLVADEIRRAERERNGQVEIRIDALLPARGDRALLRQVLSNLLQNAVKFTRARPNARIEVGSRPDGKQTVYYVKDNGAGFDERYADKLFGVFQRLHSTEEFEGTGVGLAIVKRIIQRHGGRVWAEGKVNEGATFYFSLPDGDN